MNSQRKMTAVVAGATGLVGAEVVKQLCKDDRYEKVLAIVRQESKQLKSECGEKLFFLPLPKDDDCIAGDEFYCALGTTIKKAGSEAAFRSVDYDLIIDLAKRAKRGGIKRVVVVSSVGSDPNSKIFYSRVKGETERDLKKLEIETLELYQPSLLLGQRGEFRLGERIGIMLASVIAPLMIGPLAKYAPIQARELARKMIAGEKLNV